MLLRRGNIQQGITHIGVNLGILIVQLRMCSIKQRLGLLGLAAQGIFLEERNAERAAGVARTMRRVRFTPMSP